MLKLKLSVLTLSQRLVTPRTPRLSVHSVSRCSAAVVVVVVVEVESR
eukprot:COSAG06_NODE_38034_length_428_cov_0.778116_1_plen_47_part_10